MQGVKGNPKSGRPRGPAVAAVAAVVGVGEVVGVEVVVGAAGGAGAAGAGGVAVAAGGAVASDVTGVSVSVRATGSSKTSSRSIAWPKS